MTTNFLLADTLTRIRNGQRARLPMVKANASKLVVNVLEVMKKEGYIRNYNIVTENNKSSVDIELKYFEGEPVIKNIRCLSRPGRRYYRAIRALPKVQNGLGISILSTSSGVMSDYDARQANVGGEVLCSIF